MMKRQAIGHRLRQIAGPTVQSWAAPAAHMRQKMKSNVTVEMGWGRLIFAHTFKDNESLAHILLEEKPGQRDIAFYLREPHVVLSLAPQDLFLDPSHTFRLWLHQYRPSDSLTRGFIIRRLRNGEDAEAINRIYASRHMVPADPQFLLRNSKSRMRTYLVAEDTHTNQIVGTVTGIDHSLAFKDPENGASLWCLAVDPQCQCPGVGESLVRRLIEHYITRGRAYVDLSVMHDNRQAIALYEKLGFQRVPVFCLKHKNPFNEPLFVAPAPEGDLNIYARIIINEARQRGILVDVLDEEAGYFSLHFGGRNVVCRESLTEMTTAIAMSRCDDKRVTRRLLLKAGLKVPAQVQASTLEESREFLNQYGRIVVKPARGEQGQGISVDISTIEALEKALDLARKVSENVILEEFVEGQDLRIVVIDFEVVAAAIRRPPQIVGTGQHTIAQLIEKQSRRRAAATGGESRIPVDHETERCVKQAGFTMQTVLGTDDVLTVRKTANLHTGGTIHDVTAQLHPALADAAVRAARAIDIPVVGLDFLVPEVDGEEYVIVEANERPGLANHEPQPTAERFIDFLFPQTRMMSTDRPAHASAWRQAE
jgi:GNAT-family acetyltransferase (TIGR03103 family)